MSEIRVFLADDHTIVRDGLRYLLDAQPDIKVIGDASNGREAVMRVRDCLPNIVLMDIAMPELNGIDATQKINIDCPESKVIILSIHTTTEHIFRSFDAGARGYLLKESAGGEVVKAIRFVHAGHYYLTTKLSDNLIDDYINLANISGSGGPLSSLSSREREVLQFVVEGKPNAEIGEILSISIKTVETYRSRFMTKLGINDLPTLVKFAIMHGITPLEN